MTTYDYVWILNGRIPGLPFMPKEQIYVNPPNVTLVIKTFRLGDHTFELCSPLVTQMLTLVFVPRSRLSLLAYHLF